MTSAKSKSTTTGPQEVEKFMATLDHPLKDVVAKLRQTILSTDKRITENIKWKAPSFIFDGDDKITFNLHKKDVVLVIFHRGAKAKPAKGKEPLMTDTTGLLEWLAQDRAVAKFTSMADAKAENTSLKKVVKQWISI